MNLEEIIKKKYEGLKKELLNGESYGEKNPTDVAIVRETKLRAFLKDFFPYYYFLKGSVFGKSCDFVLTNNKTHPLFETISKSTGYSPISITSEVDAIIELKGQYQEQELEAALKQAFQIKSFTKSHDFLNEKLRSLLLKDEKVNTFSISDICDKILIKHGVIFLKGKFQKKQFFKKIKSYLCENLNKYEERWNSFEGNKSREKLRVNILDNIGIEKFYKLPDFFLFFEENIIVFVDKQSSWSGFGFMHNITFLEDGITHLIAKIEDFSNETNAKRLIKEMSNSCNRTCTDPLCSMFYKRHSIEDLNDFLFFDVEHEFNWIKSINKRHQLRLIILRLLNLKTHYHEKNKVKK